MRALSGQTGTPLFRIHGVADFYPHFQLKPPPKVCMNVCADMACHIRGSDELREGLTERFRGMSASDVVIGKTSCLGQCDGAPAISINDHVYREATTAQAEALVLTALGGKPLPELPVAPPQTGLAPDPYGDGERYQAVRQLIASTDFDGVIAPVEGCGIARNGRRGLPDWHEVGSGA